MQHPNNYKYSDYLILSEQIFQNEDKIYRIVYSTRTGMTLYLNIDDFELVKERQLPEENSALFNALIRAEILVPETAEELKEILQQNQESANCLDSLIFTIIPSSYCNMGCEYCGQSHKKEHLNDSLLNKIVERIQNRMQLRSTKRVEVNWFGAEPMVGYSRIIKISQVLIPTADELKIEYSSSMTTNGSLLTLDKVRQLFFQARVKDYQITIDGPADIHNQRRRLKKSSQNNFEHNIKIVQQIIASPELQDIQITLRTNIDKDNQVFVNEYLQMMHDFGFNHKNVNFDLTFVHSWSNDVSAIEMPKKEFAEQEILWMIKMMQLGLRFTLIPRRKKIVCVAVTPSAEVIGANGNIFSCTEHPLIPIHEINDAIGHVVQADNRSTGRFDQFNIKSIQQLPCSKCLFIGLCGGACPKHWEEGHVPCPSFKYNMQQRLDLAAIKNGYRMINKEFENNVQ